MRRATMAVLMAGVARGSVVFVKTYKTGSTTVSEFLSLLSYRENLYSLHPLRDGNFAPGELGSRAARGERYDVMYRHPTPLLDEVSLDRLVPNALWVTIMREPVSRFLSAFVFVKRLSVRHTPASLVAAARRDALPAADTNTFCNNVAWVLRGERASLAFDNSSRTFDDLARKLDENYLVLMQDDMPHSLALLAHRMRLDATGLGGGRARVSDRGSRPECDAACREAVLSCSPIDLRLYVRFKAKFRALLEDDDVTRIRRDLDAPRPPDAPRPDLARYPINCQQPGTGPPHRQHWKTLHSCHGRPDAAPATIPDPPGPPPVRRVNPRDRRRRRPRLPS